MLSQYGGLPFYAGMLEAAGITPSSAMWAEADLDRVVFWGSPERIGEQVRDALAQGIDEISLKLFSAQPVADLHRLLPVLRGFWPAAPDQTA
jgi:hypothetical protein